MRTLRLVGSALLLGALAAAVTRTTSSAANASEAHCTQVELAAAFDGQLQLDSFQKFGCVDGWAFTWATVGSGQSEVSVTEVLQFLPIEQRWMLVTRQFDCTPDVLPPSIYRQGCFSN